MQYKPFLLLSSISFKRCTEVNLSPQHVWKREHFAYGILFGVVNNKYRFLLIKYIKTRHKRK